MTTATNVVELRPMTPAQPVPIEAMGLAELEAVIAAGLHTFVDVGRALARIKEVELYKNDHKTFEAYCRDKWDFGKGYANHQIRAANLTATIVAKGLPAPGSEGVCRALSKVPEQDRAKVWAALVEGRQAHEVTAKEVTVAVSKHVEKQAPKEAEAKPAKKKHTKPERQPGLPGRLRKQLREVVREFVEQRVQEFDCSAVAEDMLNDFEWEVSAAFDDMLAKIRRISRTAGAQDIIKTKRRGLARACEILMIKPPSKNRVIDFEEARLKHRKLSARYHPDRTGLDNDAPQTVQYREIQEAWEIVRSHSP